VVEAAEVVVERGVEVAIVSRKTFEKLQCARVVAARQRELARVLTDHSAVVA